MLCEEGSGVPQDDVEAAAWHQAAAEKEHPEAQLEIGLRHGAGRGVSQDLIEAYRWLALAAGNPQLVHSEPDYCSEHVEAGLRGDGVKPIPS